MAATRSPSPPALLHCEVGLAPIERLCLRSFPLNPWGSVTVAEVMLCIFWVQIKKIDITSLWSWDAHSLNPAPVRKPISHRQAALRSSCQKPQVSADSQYQSSDMRLKKPLADSPSLGNSMRDLSENHLAELSQLPESWGEKRLLF